MGVKVSASMDDISKFLEKETRKHLQRLIASLEYIGEEVVNGIRDGRLSNWNDDTGNLRSSIGYVVSLDGKPVRQSAFEPISTTADSGSAEGLAYAKRLASLYPKGIALIVVAGKDYASYVEAVKNKVVLAKGEIEARKLVKQLMKEIDKMANGNDTD